MKKKVLTTVIISLAFITSLFSYTYEAYYPELNTEFFKGNDSPGITGDIAETGVLLRGINYDIPFTLNPGESMLIRIALPAGVVAFSVGATSNGWLGAPANQNPQFEIFAYDPGSIENAITLEGMQASYSAGLGRTFVIDGTQESGIGNERAMPGGSDKLEWGRMLYLVCYNVPTNQARFSFMSFTPTMVVPGGVSGAAYLRWQADRPFAGGTGTLTGDGVDYSAGGSSSVNDNDLTITDCKLYNYPNPFNPTTKISYELPTANYKKAEIVVYNVMGEEVWSSKSLSSNTNHCTFNGSSFNSGIYYYSLIIDGKKMDTKSMVLMK